MRNKGEGSTTKTATGYKWKLRYGGSIDQKSITRSAKTLRELNRKKDEALNDLRKRGFLDVDKTTQTVEQAIERWIAAKPRADNTIHSYQQTLRLNIAPAIGSQRTDRPPAQLADQLVRHMQKTSPGRARTIDLALTMLCSALGVNKKNVKLEMTEVVPKPNGPRNRILETDDQTAKFLETLHQSLGDGPRFTHRWIIEFLLWTGLRRGEVVALKVDDFDEKTLELHVRSQINERTGKTVSGTKNKTTRILPLHPRAVECIREHRLAMPMPSDVLFASSTGKPICQRNLNRTVAEVCKLADLPHISVHDLRRSFLTAFAETEANIRVVADYAGHRNVSTTLTHYTQGRRQRMATSIQNLTYGH